MYPQECYLAQIAINNDICSFIIQVMLDGWFLKRFMNYKLRTKKIISYIYPLVNIPVSESLLAI